MRKVAQEKGLNFKEEEGEAAFYGPKLDFKIKDCIGRLWQCSTLQFDFNLPERFDMNFINKEGVNERPYVLHRALFGSFERFIGLLIEHYAGAFPLWITPEQMRILPVSDAFLPYAEKAYARLKSEGFRVTLDDANESLGKKIRSAEQEKVNYALIIGEKEVAGNLVAVRNTRTKEQVTMDLEAFVVSAKQEVEERKI